MKILLTGACGMLGSAILAKNHGQHKIVPTTHNHNYSNFVYLDITDFESVEQVIYKHDVECVIHLAAITNVDFCQTHPHQAILVNYLATKNIAKVCRNNNIPLIFMSSGAVFSGSKHSPYKENDYRHPINIYGQSKKLAEDYVRHLVKYCIIRTGWLIGGHDKDHKFVSLMLRQINKGNKNLVAISNIFGSPTITYDLAGVIFQIVNHRIFGTYHVANSGLASRYDIVKEMINCLGINDTQATSVRYGYFKESAPRPKMEGLDCEKIKKKHGILLPDWKKSFCQYLTDYVKK